MLTQSGAMPVSTPQNEPNICLIIASWLVIKSRRAIELSYNSENSVNTFGNNYGKTYVDFTFKILIHQIGLWVHFP